MATSPAIDGAMFASACSFEVAIPASGAPTTAVAFVTSGSYEIAASVDCYLCLSGSNAAPLPSTQPAATAPNATRRLFAGQIIGLDVQSAAVKWSVVSVTASTGTLTFNGPVNHWNR